MRKIEHKEIDKYLNYFNEFKYMLENDIKFNVSELQQIHNVDIKSNPSARNTGLLSISGRGRGIEYMFKVDTIEPHHIRNVIVDIIKENSKSNNNSARKEKSEQIEPNNSKTVTRYHNFMKSYYILQKEGVKFNISDLIKKHGVSKNITWIAKKNNVSLKTEPTINDAKVLYKAVNKYQHKATLRYREKTKNKIVSNTDIEEQCKVKNIETYYYLFGIKFMKSISKITY